MPLLGAAFPRAPTHLAATPPHVARGHGALGLGGGGGPAASGAPTFGVPVLLPSSNDFAEPSIAADAAGVLYVVAPGSASTGVWRSLDGGASFARVANSLGRSGDSDIAIDADGFLYVADLSDRVPVSVSFDNGTSFAYKTESALAGSLDRQWLAAAGSGTVFSAWRDGSAMRLGISPDHARTWTRSVIATDVQIGGGILAVTAQDLWIPLVTGSGTLQVGHSSNGGATWTLRPVATGLGEIAVNPANAFSFTFNLNGGTLLFPTVAVDETGNAYVVWAENPPTMPDGGIIRFSASRDGGATWSAPVNISEAGTYNLFPWIVAGAAGHVAIGWYQGALPAPVALDANAAVALPWHVQVASAPDADAATPTWSQAAATGVIHRGSVCTFGSACVGRSSPLPVFNRALLDFFEMTRLPDGRIAITFATDQADETSAVQGSRPRLAVAVQNGGFELG